MRIGWLWLLIQPTIQAGVLALVFVKIFGIRGIEHYPLFVLCGLLPWACFQQSTMQSLTAGLDNAALVKKVPVPTVIFPFAAAVSQVMALGLQSLVLLVAALAAGTLSPMLLILPVAVALQTVLALGLGLLVGAFLPAVRDLRVLMESGLLLLFYATPIVYASQRLPASVRDVVRFNPLDGVMQLHRAAWMGQPVDAIAVMVSVGTAVGLFCLGLFVYGRRSRLFADLI
jgi:ABC-2 type transport system permease protein